MTDDRLVTLIAGHLTYADQRIRQGAPMGLALMLPNWSADGIDMTARSLATILRAAVDEVVAEVHAEDEEAA